MSSKDELHDALQAHARAMAGVPPEAFLSRWLIVRELILPGAGEKALNFVSGDAAGQTLTVWDAEALIRGYLREIHEQGWSPPPAPPNPGPPPDGEPDLPF